MLSFLNTLEAEPQNQSGASTQPQSMVQVSSTQIDDDNDDDDFDDDIEYANGHDDNIDKEIITL